MQKWLDDNNVLMYSTHNEVTAVVAERFVRTLKSKIYKKIPGNNKTYLGYFNKFVDEYSNSYLHSIGKKPADADYSALTEKIDSSHKAPKLKIGDRVRISKNKIIFSKGYMKIGQKKYL